MKTTVPDATQVTPALLNLGLEIPPLFDRQMSEETQLQDPQIHTNSLKSKMQELITWVRLNM
jgi:hypothetical protein